MGKPILHRTKNFAQWRLTATCPIHLRHGPISAQPEHLLDEQPDLNRSRSGFLLRRFSPAAEPSLLVASRQSQVAPRFSGRSSTLRSTPALPLPGTKKKMFPRLTTSRRSPLP